MEEAILLKTLTEDRLEELMIKAMSKALESHSKQELKYTSRKEKAEQLGISLPTLDKGIDQGKFKTMRVGGRILIVDKGNE